MEVGTAGLRERLQTALGGAYTLERELGGGGMSHVFVARDATFGRDVVVKVLPPDAAAALSAERFKREIALAARLQHPHIVPVLTAGVTADGLPYYTMPFVEGESLRARLARAGELSVAETVSVLKDVTRALAYAHGRGVVHRDIKPDNVLLSGGAAVVTDFGVAKALDASTTSGAGTTLTGLGVALGTPAYMSPEQAAADPSVDHRADLYALGCVAYEMLTGQPPFTGRPVPALLAAHVSEAPELVQNRRPNVPSAIAALVMRCLEKRPADRPASAEDLIRVLDHATTSDSRMEAPQTVRPASVGRAAGRAKRRVRGMLLVTLAAAAVGATGVMAGWALRGRRTDDRGLVVRSVLPLDADEYPQDLGCPSYALSADGRLLVYTSVKAGVPVLRVHASDRLDSHTLEGAGSPRCATISPDGRRIAYEKEGELRTISVEGGPTTRLAAPPPTVARAFAGATWATAETIVLSDGVALWAISTRDAPPRRLFADDATSESSRGTATDTARRGLSRMWPHALPDGRGVLYTRVTDGDVADARLGIVSLDGRRTTLLDLAGTYAVGVVAGRLVYVDASGAVKAVRFDERQWRVSGDPVTLIPHIERTSLGAASLALSSNGTLAFLSGLPLAAPVLLDRRGGRRLLPLEPRPYTNPRFSPDGGRIAFGLDDGNKIVDGGVWIYDVVAGTLTRLTTRGGATRPEWSADGTRVLYVSRDTSPHAGRRGTLWWQPVDGSGPASRLFAARDADVLEGVLAPDGRTLVYRTRVGGARNIMAVQLPGANATDSAMPRVLVTGPGNEVTPRVSPDGRWLAYASDESGMLQVYVRPFPGPGGRTQISIAGGTEPLWTRDGQHLLYRDGRRVVDATFREEPTFGVVSREPFVEGDYDANWAHANYDVAPDGARVLMLERAGAPQQIIVVHRWVRELLAATGE